MSKDERYDIVIIGGGPNGMATAAYLAKSKHSVCLLEEKTECGGACETQEPIPGVRIYPHTALARTAVHEGVVAPDDDLLQPRFYIQKGLEDWLRETARRWMEDRPHWFM